MSDAKAHSPLGPSSAVRWLNCTGSTRVIAEVYPDGVPDRSSVYAQEGTTAHDLAELVAQKHLGLRPRSTVNAKIRQWRETVPDEDTQQEMMRHAQYYAEYLQRATEPDEEAPEGAAAPLVLLEQRVDTGIPQVWGTSDAIVVANGRLEIVDFKYGMGVQVSSEDNPQMKLYALGAIRLVEDLMGDLLGPLDEIKMTIIQPRTSTPMSTAIISRQYLEDWAEQVATPAAMEALEQTGKVVPSLEACRWCPASGACAVQAEKVVKQDFGAPSPQEPEVMTPQQLAEKLELLDGITHWVDSVKSYAMDLMYQQGVQVPGFKAVWRSGRRTIKDHQKVIDQLLQQGYTLEQVARPNTQTISRLEKLLGGKEQLENLIGEHITTTAGSPAIAKESDKREAVTALAGAALEFSDDLGINKN